MVTALVGSKKSAQSGEFVKEYYGLSTDTQPLYADGARNADIFFNIDTTIVQFFDEDNNKWVPESRS